MQTNINLVTDKIEIIKSDICDLVNSNGEKIQVDIIVNAAKPSLMGGHGVDGAIHKAINSNLKDSTFCEKIRAELDCGDCRKDRIRCKTGDAVVTKGYGLSKYIIHAVGPVWDGGSKSCYDLLKKTYENIIERMLSTECSTIAIPVISSGSYGVPFDVASRVQIVSVINCLLKLKNKEPMLYNQIHKIYFVVFIEREIESYLNIFQKYKEKMVNDTQLLLLSANEAVDAYVKEIELYDYAKRNYFGLIKKFRLFLVKSDKFFFVSYVLKKTLGDKNWHSRRTLIEIEVLVKTFLSIMLLYWPFESNISKLIAVSICIYLMTETIAYISKLVFLSDIQNASANIYRSIVLLFLNCIEINFCFAFLYKIAGALNYVDKEGNSIVKSSIDYLHFSCVNSTQIPTIALGKYIVCIQTAIQFYIVTIVIAYFVSNFNKIKFNS